MADAWMRNHCRANVKTTPLDNAIGALELMCQTLAGLSGESFARTKDFQVAQIRLEVDRLKQLVPEARDFARACEAEDKVAAINDAFDSFDASGRGPGW